MLLDIVEVSYVEGYKVLITFENGERKTADLEDRLKSKTGAIAEQLRDRAYFSQVKVNSETGTIEWPNGEDICPDLLYRIGVSVLEQKAG